MYILIRCYFHNIIFLVYLKFQLRSGKAVHRNEYFDIFSFFLCYNFNHCFGIDVRALFYLHKTIANFTSSFQKSYTALQSSVHWVAQIVRNNVMSSTPFIFPLYFFAQKTQKFNTMNGAMRTIFFRNFGKIKCWRNICPFCDSKTSCYAIQSVISIGISFFSFPFIQCDFINSP